MVANNSDEYQIFGQNEGFRGNTVGLGVNQSLKFLTRSTARGPS